MEEIPLWKKKKRKKIFKKDLESKIKHLAHFLPLGTN